MIFSITTISKDLLTWLLIPRVSVIQIWWKCIWAVYIPHVRDVSEEWCLLGCYAMWLL
jgi:hypothetical protein